jgi:hypothetical protein
MAQGIAVTIVELRTLNALDESAKSEIIQKLKQQGGPTSLEQAINMAASVITEQKMGWYKKNQFLGMIQGSLLAMGLSNADAAYYKGIVELRAR